MPTFGSLFSGIGGLDLGLERAGWECRWQVEIDPWCRKVLAKHWPDVPKYGDVREIDWRESYSRRLVANADERQFIEEGALRPRGTVAWRCRVVEPVDLICGGFPCQPVSVAGKRLGELDERWLWPEFARVLRLLRPRYALIENVPGLFHRGFDTVLRDLHEAGFDAEWFCLRASDVGAPHRRERVFIVAHANGGSGSAEHGQQQEERPEVATGSGTARLSHVAFANGSGRGGREDDEGEGQTGRGRTKAGGEVLADASIQRQPLIEGSAAHGVLAGSGGIGRDGGYRGADAQWLVEPDVGRVANGVPSRVDRLRGLGNAVVPQVAEYIGKQLKGVITESRP